MQLTGNTCFECLDGSLDSEWAAIQKYFSFWHDCPVAANSTSLPTGFSTNSVSVREWTKLVQTLQDSELAGTLRDYAKLENVPRHDAIGFLWQCEGDFIWAIEREHWHEHNPEVVGFILDYDASETTFLPAGLVAESLSEFALIHSSHFMYRTFASATVSAPNSQAWLQEMTSSFSVVRHLGGTQIFENSGVIALISTDPFEPDSRHLKVAVRHAEDLANCPDACLGVLKNGGSFTGYFGEDSFRGSSQAAPKKTANKGIQTKPFWKFW